MVQRQSKALWQAARAFWRHLGIGSQARQPVGVGLALGGGFARAIAHIGVLRVFEREGIPIAAIAGVSAGSIVAAGFAGGATSHELEQIARSMRFRDVAGWRPGKLGFVATDRMESFLRKTLPADRFERMRIPLAIVATDLHSGQPAVFRDSGEIFTALRASCSYPGLFHPVQHEGRLLVDGAVGMEIPALPVRELGATHVVAVILPPPAMPQVPTSLFTVVGRCFQILQRRTEHSWRSASDLVIAPRVTGVAWDDLSQVSRMIATGERAAEAALPEIHKWLSRSHQQSTGTMTLRFETQG
jgi:NTE family protein